MKMIFQYGWVFVALILVDLLWAETWGSVSGRVYDRQTGKQIIGANIIVENTGQGATTDENGFYIIIRVAPGVYNVRFTMIGYKPIIQEKVMVTPDIRTTVDFETEVSVLDGETVVVNANKRRLQTGITSTIRFVAEEELQNLPIRTFIDAIELLPGINSGHFRGGRKTEVLYLIDGMPLQNAAEREISMQIPLNVISDISVQTGGFNAEYGNVMSGVVNIITKETNKIFSSTIMATNEKESKFVTPLFKDNINNVNSNIILEGKMPIVPIKYFTSSHYSHPLNSWKYEEFGERRIISTNDEAWEWSIISKLHNNPGANLRFVFSNMVFFREWKEYEHRWKYNTKGLPNRRQQNFRSTLSITKSISDKSFLYSNLGIMYFLKSIIGAPTNALEEYKLDDIAGDWVMSGDYPWWMDHEEKTVVWKTGFVLQLDQYHQLKIGTDFLQYDLYKKNMLIREIPTIDPNFRRYLTYDSEYDYQPKTTALYIQDKLIYDQLVVNAGIRYDTFDPMALRPVIEENIVNDETAWVIKQDSTTEAALKTQLSPRLGVAFLVGPDSELRINYGHFFQMPAFDYLYTNSNRNIASGFSPITLGNPDLQPSKTVAYEVGFHGIYNNRFIYDFALYNKDVTNLIDVGTYLSQNEDDEDIPVSGFIEYRNMDYSNIFGAEASLAGDLNESISGEINYTFMVAKGSGSNPISALQQILNDIKMTQTIYPLSWDQRHGIVFNFTYHHNSHNITVLYQYDSGIPYTHNIGWATVPNNARLKSTNQIDLRYKKTMSLKKQTFEMYFEILNVFDVRNNLWSDYYGKIGGRLKDPGAWDTGRYIRLGFEWNYTYVQ